jgi:hypothetical protein
MQEKKGTAQIKVSEIERTIIKLGWRWDGLFGHGGSNLGGRTSQIFVSFLWLEEQTNNLCPSAKFLKEENRNIRVKLYNKS